MENNYINPDDGKDWKEAVEEKKKLGKFNPETYFPLDTYDMVQMGYL